MVPEDSGPAKHQKTTSGKLDRSDSGKYQDNRRGGSATASVMVPKNKACAPFAAAESIAIAFGRMSSTNECGSGENTGKRSEFEMLHQKWIHWHAWKNVAGVG